MAYQITMTFIETAIRSTVFLNDLETTFCLEKHLCYNDSSSFFQNMAP